MKTATLPDGSAVPVMGQGTWMMAESRGSRDEEIAALRAGIDLGMTLVDTAEIYAHGRSEELVGEAIAGRRDEVFLVSKVAPHHASRTGTRRACEASLKRLGTDRLDLYLLHWPGGVPLGETVEALAALKQDGLIRNWGVSNFDTEEMEELFALPGGEDCATNQILYNLEERGPEFDLLPWMAERGVPAMAYSPVGQGGALLDHPVLHRVAQHHRASPAQVALAFLVDGDDVIAIPKAGSATHVRENAAAADLVLGLNDRHELDAAFPPPKEKRPLAVI
ncbi:aldo/keto reductase [Aureimonas leprariae]|uniref:Aldo/keto reductase n=1 Tax=Plantimonas leprariae TaxID=2615207 RepID=A0A7V7TUW6_9HYPH|nr:aldo/keto reductase [Aureimonas leprariae]KAB0677082.1 aldo/keto reductase [Aureimonas leprariae]